MAYAYCIEGSVICPNCAWRYMGITALSIQAEEAEGYPDGYTCDECDTTVKEQVSDTTRS